MINILSQILGTKNLIHNMKYQPSFLGGYIDLALILNHLPFKLFDLARGIYLFQASFPEWE